MAESPKIAVVIDALSTYSGAERVLAAVLELYPAAPIHTLVYQPEPFVDTLIAKREIRTSWIQRLPGAMAHYRDYLPLLPLAVEKFDLRGYDIVLSFSYAVAHGVLCGPDQLHISYTFAPLRYAWQSAHEYFQEGLLSPAAAVILHYLRLWDRNTAARVDHFAAISKWTAACVWRAYRRDAEVIYPPVEIERFQPLKPRADYYVAFSRLVRHKRLEMTVQAFSKLGLPLLVIGDGPERKKLERLAAPNVRLLGRRSNEAAAELVGRARGLVHAAEEDFGLVMAEAQAAGCPVIAYGRGAAGEIIREGRTGLLFHEATVKSLMEAVECFEEKAQSFSSDEASQNAERFSKGRFQRAFAEMVERQWQNFVLRRGSPSAEIRLGAYQVNQT